MTLKVTAAIHWEAMKLWAKGVPVFEHRKARARVATSVDTTASAAACRASHGT